MLESARRATKALGDSAELVVEFLRSQLSADGGFMDRAGRSDLYYSVFGMEGLMALGADAPRSQMASYVDQFGDGEGLDLVHVSCLARCWVNLNRDENRSHHGTLLEHIEAHRSEDGGYHAKLGQAPGTIYGCFLAAGAYENLGQPMPRADEMLRSIDSLKCSDGGYANHQELPIGMTAPTAAAAMLHRYLRRPIDPAIAPWLLAQAHAQGGFLASPVAPMPDLLSTATALHALAAAGADLSKIKEPTLNFIDSLWSNRGAFYGNWGDDTQDCEYAYYGLLALGHLS
jgi:hypothetical protein